MISLVKLLRPHQWLKNLMLFFPPFLGGALFREGLALQAVFPLVAFCLVSSAAYVLNDLVDADKDTLHPVKKLRPIASGAISKKVALTLSVVLSVSSFFAAASVSNVFVGLVFLYLVINIAYSLKLKEQPLLDIFCISAGFLIRLFAGGEAFDIIISHWLFLSVFLLSIFLSTGKRQCESFLLGCEAGEHRRSLQMYPEGFLEGVMYMTGAAVLVTYTMYVINRPNLIWTVPLCCYGLFRYILRVKSGLSGDPTDSLFRDRQLFAVGLAWALIIGWGTYA